MNSSSVDTVMQDAPVPLSFLCTLQYHARIYLENACVVHWHAHKVMTTETSFRGIHYLLVLSTVFQRDSVAQHWIFIWMAQAITSHNSALAGRSISYYCLKLTFLLQASLSLPEKGRPASYVERRRGKRDDSEGCRIERTDSTVGRFSKLQCAISYTHVENIRVLIWLCMERK